MKGISGHPFHPLGFQRCQGPIIYGLCTELSRSTMKENEQFSFIQTGPVVLIAPDSAFVGFRPYCGKSFAIKRAKIIIKGTDGHATDTQKFSRGSLGRMLRRGCCRGWGTRTRSPFVWRPLCQSHADSRRDRDCPPQPSGMGGEWKGDIAAPRQPKQSRDEAGSRAHKCDLMSPL